MASTASLDVHNDCTFCVVRSGGFCNVSPASLDALNAVKLTAVHPKMSPLFTEGEMPRAVFVLCGGRAKVTSSSAEGKTLIMRIAAPGEVLGVSATILGRPYEVTAETLDSAQVSTIKRADFLQYGHVFRGIPKSARGEDKSALLRCRIRRRLDAVGNHGTSGSHLAVVLDGGRKHGSRWRDDEIRGTQPAPYFIMVTRPYVR